MALPCSSPRPLPALVTSSRRKSARHPRLYASHRNDAPPSAHRHGEPALTDRRASHLRQGLRPPWRPTPVASATSICRPVVPPPPGRAGHDRTSEPTSGAPWSSPPGVRRRRAPSISVQRHRDPSPGPARRPPELLRPNNPVLAVAPLASGDSGVFAGQT
ncbi:pollen-specific leucine-rich repeat extensin-like protein 4 [Iris pallida]|uniref:Pollen-specific leucine-rich repeat extensin-like protein 4 n=1 Tax=Iris pallida TaxID=29817 RepID=A0AAX6DG79_IRIPA|nr:pollen-specific leucine-rich repeat extensin-like protein 4 [Iris pallida]